MSLLCRPFASLQWPQCTAAQSSGCRYGKIVSVRLRSVPVDLEKKMPRKAAVLSGAIAAARGSSHAYVVFADAGAASKALAHNMQEVGPMEGKHRRQQRWTCARQIHAWSLVLVLPADDAELILSYAGVLPR